ncbi:MAG: hypothetical protein ACREND_03640 [Gemmatimonadaceae bacterium]
MKQAHPDLDEARQIPGFGLELYAGDDYLTLPFLELGGRAARLRLGQLGGRELGFRRRRGELGAAQLFGGSGMLVAHRGELLFRHRQGRLPSAQIAHAGTEGGLGVVQLRALAEQRRLALDLRAEPRRLGIQRQEPVELAAHHLVARAIVSRRDRLQLARQRCHAIALGRDLAA